MKLSIDENPSSKYKKCPNCNSKYLSITDFVLNDEHAYAVAYIDCHRHHNSPELFFTVILGSWAEGEYDDHVTFACRYGGLINGGEEVACTLLDVSDVYDKPIFGKRLTRDQALKHPKVTEFWEIIDYLIEYDIKVHDYLKHPIKSRIRHII